MRARWHGILAWVLLALGGCSPELTEVIVVVDSDLDVPEQLDTIVIEVTGPGGEFRRAIARLDGDMRLPLPRTLGVVHRGGPLEPLTVMVEGRAGGSAVIQRHARTGFVQGETRVLRMNLLRSCVGKGCEIDQTCTELGCQSEDVPPEELEPWDGRPGRLDASVAPDAGDGGVEPDGGGCVPVAEVCNELDDDCDGDADEDFDLQADTSNCGRCDVVCEADPMNGASACEAGECVLHCDAGWADCNGLAEDGCEALLSEPETCGNCDTACTDPEPFCAGDDTRYACAAGCGTRTLCGGSCVNTDTNPQHCGSCGNRCPSRPHASPACESGTCGYVCDEGWHDCDGVPDNGCESRLRSSTNCGACGMTCDLPNASESCTTGSCRIVACDSGYADCNGSAADGCEVNLNSDRSNCGSCGNACPADRPNASSTCGAGSCELVCDSGYADCDGDPSNGCEANLASAETCGSCGIRCSGSTPACASDGSGGHTCVSGCGSGETLCSGSCVDTNSDPSHCGECDNACPDRPHSSPTCTGGSCGIRCDSGWGDCNGDTPDGCEASLSTSDHCGSCGTVCALEHATASCTSDYDCVITSCESGWGDCNGDPSDGCETSLSTTDHCGSCRNTCPSTAPNASGSTCSEGSCVLSCDGGFGDCNGRLDDGCETNTNTSPMHCGSCGNRCVVRLSCCDGECLGPPVCG